MKKTTDQVDRLERRISRALTDALGAGVSIGDMTEALERFRGDTRQLGEELRDPDEKADLLLIHILREVGGSGGGTDAPSPHRHADEP
jgi:hypothetical protein